MPSVSALAWWLRRRATGEGQASHQHVLHEQSVVGARAEHAHVDAVLGVPAGVAVDDEDPVAHVEVVEGAPATARGEGATSVHIDGVCLCRRVAYSRLSMKDFSSILMLTGPHHTLSTLADSSTMRLSLGDRPVFAPERTARAPVEVR